MMKFTSGTARRSIGALAAATIGLGLLAGCGGSSDDASPRGKEEAGSDSGLSDEKIVLGTSLPLSGPASALGVVNAAYSGCVDKLNDGGGVKMADGVTRQLELISYDDGYDPAKTVENVRRLVEQDGVFAVWGTLGTEPNSAVWDYMTDKGVPHPFILSGASKFGTGFLDDHPVTLGWQPAYTTEAAVYGQYVVDTMPDATVAILYQNDDYGDDFRVGFERAIEGSDVTVVAEKSYEATDPTVDQQMVDLADTDADVFLNVTTPKFATQSIAKLAEMDWEPLHIINSLASSPAVFEPAGFENVIGVISAQFLKDPSDPQWDDDAGMKAYREDAAKYSAGEDIRNTFMEIGWASCDSMRQLLENSEPTRESVIEAMKDIDFDNPLTLPGLVLKTGPDDGYLIESMQLGRFTEDGWELVGDVISFEGATPQN